MTTTHSPSIYEVASSAGVSVATVSRVLNGKGPVHEETRRRVLDAVEALGYVPHGAARSLSTRRTMNVGVLLPDVHGAFFSEIVRGIDLAARAAGYHVLVSSSHSDLAETTEVLQALHGRIDGLILLNPAAADADWLRRTLPPRVPAVLLHDPGDDAEHDSIRIDNRLGARLATDHLLDLGHRRIAMILGPRGNSDAAERLVGFHEALTARGLPANPRLELPGDFGEESGFRAGERLAGLGGARPTAVFAANDAMAIGCLAALRDRGLRVPEDVSLAGFDDIPIARYLTPALTTVQVPIAEIGGRALKRLVTVIQSSHEGKKRHDVVTPTLAVRASTAAASRA
jgi:LacI family transcriptional regulator, galactose operon repressor